MFRQILNFLRRLPPLCLIGFAGGGLLAVFPVCAEDSGDEGEAVPVEEKTVPIFHRMDAAAVAEVVKSAREHDDNLTPTEALLEKGIELVNNEEYAAAIPLLEETIARNAVQPNAWEALGTAWIKSGEPERARILWNYYLSLSPEDAFPYALLARVELAERNWNAAEEYYKKALAIDPTPFDLRFWYAQNLMRLGKSKEAIAEYRKLVQEEPGRLDVQAELAILLQNGMEYDEAVEIMRHINEELPGNISRMLDQAELELLVGELPAAEKICAQVLAEEPSNSRAIRMQADMAMVGGGDLGRIQEAIDRNKDSPLLQASLYSQLAGACVRANRRQPNTFSQRTILSFAARAMQLDPLNADYQITYAQLLVGAHSWERAKRWAVKVLQESNRHSIQAKRILFEVALALKKWDEAEQALNDLYGNYDPTSQERYIGEARLLAQKGEYEDALQRLDQLEAAAAGGTVLTLLYHGLTESDWMPTISVRRLNEQLQALQQEGFTFISPVDIPKYIGLEEGEQRPTPEDWEQEPVPALAQAIDWTQGLFSGERRFKDGQRLGLNPYKLKKPMKVVAVTFDGGLRSSLILGSPVAKSLGAQFGMFVNTKEPPQHEPSRAGWAELINCAKTGQWVLGSHLHDANEKGRLDAAGTRMADALPNRIWNERRERLESMNEWDRRMRREFRLSWEILQKESGQDLPKLRMVAYPQGDVGQKNFCNLPSLRNPVSTILAEAKRTYQMGFLQTPSGYTCKGDNLMRVGRYEPSWTEEADDVVRNAYELHPVFRARRLRVELALMMGRAHMAEEMLTLLRRDGYPPELCRELVMDIDQRFRNKRADKFKPLVATTSQPAAQSASTVQPGSGATRTTEDSNIAPKAQHVDVVGRVENFARGLSDREAAAQMREVEEMPDPDLMSEHVAETNDFLYAGADESALFNETSSGPWVRLNRPFGGVRLDEAKYADDFKTDRWNLHGGLNLNDNSSLAVDYSEMHIRQRIAAQWNGIFEDYTAGDASNDAPQRHTLKAKRSDLTARYSHRIGSGAVVSATFGIARYVFDDDEWLRTNDELEDRVGTGVFHAPEDDSVPIGGLSAHWMPYNDLSLRMFYLRDAVVSAAKLVETDSAGGSVQWNPIDGAQADLRTQYWSYEDKNAMYFVEADAFLRTFGEIGVWTGLDWSTTTSSEPSDFYWTPYWDSRLMGVLRYFQSWNGYSFKMDLMGGMQRSKGRSLRRVADEQFVGGQGWRAAGGFSFTYTKQLLDWLNIFIDGDMMALNDYIDHRFLLGFDLAF